MQVADLLCAQVNTATYPQLLQVRREGEGGSFPGPRDVRGAPPSLKNTEGISAGFFLT